MHRLAAVPGGWQMDGTPEGVVFIEQSPAPIVVLTAADTDVQLLALTLAQLPAEFPAVRVVNLLQLQQQLTIDTYAEEVLSQAQVIILRLLGGQGYWSYGFEVVQETVRQTQAALFALPGDDRPDPNLFSHSTPSLSVVNQLWCYFTEGGVENYGNALRFVAQQYLNYPVTVPLPQPIPRLGVYNWQPESGHNPPVSLGTAAILFYRANYLAGNTAAIDALCAAVYDCGLQPLPVYVQSLQDGIVQGQLAALLQQADLPLAVVLNTTSFSLAKLGAAVLDLKLWQQLDVPVLQVMLGSSPEAQWQRMGRGLGPRDMAMNVALPEVDGRVIGRAIAFKAVQRHHGGLETEIVHHQPVADRVAFVAALAANWARLRQTPTAQRRVALILANYPCRDGRLANGVGLDTPASCVEILRALQRAGYTLPAVPADSEALMQALTTGVTNDPEGRHCRPAYQWVSLAEYQQFLGTLPETVQTQLRDRWGDPAAEVEGSGFAISGLQLGNIFIGIQPSRGYDQDPSLNYHAPDLEPPHAYLVFYYWLRQQFQAQAVVHVGKHGNLEWLPGKGVALSETCYPEVALGPLPHLYPFIVNDPGEGTQAKRRAQAVIIDHLTPPLTRAELYGPLQQLEGMIDEYYEAQDLDPARLPVIRDRILTLIQQENLHQELTLGEDSNLTATNLEQWLATADGYLCELKEAQIRDGLHIFGCCPQGVQLRDLTLALARHPHPKHQGLTRALAQDGGLTFDPLGADPSQPLAPEDQVHLQSWADAPCRHQGDAIAVLETQAAHLVDALIAERAALPFPVGPTTQQELDWIRTDLLPALRQTHQELDHLLLGLAGRFVPSGASGAPTRGRPDVLPTGRNFYSVDIRGLPTESAWTVGRLAAEALIERYTQEHGEYPRTLGLSMWGTATMRTGGDDIAEALALMGVQPVWEGPSRRVIDFEILPLSLLGRPRVDVTLRISGLFRDAFPNLIDLFDRAVQAVASLSEPPTQNPLAAQVQEDVTHWCDQGVDAATAHIRARYRIFGSKPGAYGAGLQGLLESHNWETEADLARAYLNWSSYAYTAQPTADVRQAIDENLPDAAAPFAPEAFNRRLGQMQIVLHNQDNREHDLLDSDDYYQFQGGMAAAVRTLTGETPTLYFGDHALPTQPKVRTLQAELARVYRARVINPKWMAGAMRHGYKGAFEMAATVDFLFAYDATTGCIPDYMYAGVADAYVLDPQVQSFVQRHNPWALRDMAERLLEAHQRGLWQAGAMERVERLRSQLLDAEAQIETRTLNPEPPSNLP